jgi:alkyl sulfatase BDS1-like metallo-beta-lactamase superfamily hydrolase
VFPDPVRSSDPVPVCTLGLAHRLQTRAHMKPSLLSRGLVALSLVTVAGCGSPKTPSDARSTELSAAEAQISSRTGAAIQGDATAITRKANADAASGLPFQDTKDFADARQGFIAKRSGDVRAPDGRVVWSFDAYAFEDADAVPPTVHPSLWRQARLNGIHGLFKVADRVYQLRGFDVSNMDVIEGNTGLIVIDPLVSTETAKAALDFYYQHRPKKPVVAVIYSHSHVDHYGGALGVVKAADVKAKRVQVFAPDGFLEHAVSENVYAGNAMSRRSQYMYGITLPTNARGQVDIGLGKAPSTGTISLVPPTDTIAKPIERRNIDGIDVEFQLTPNTEAPAEMNMYFPQQRVLCAAENATHNLHNILTLRGAPVRDAHAWAKYLNEALQRYGDKSDVVMAQHHWPTFGQANVREFLTNQRDMYKYLHDQTVRLMNKGYRPMDIAESLRLPPSLESKWYAHGYYGSMSHDSRAVYQRYLGFYDGNPADLNPLPPVESAKKTVEYMGGAQSALERAKRDFDAGNYRWVAQVTKSLVFADPGNKEAKKLLANALEQLGYQSENGTWRDSYLTGAQELRQGVTKAKEAQSTASPETIRALTVPMGFDYMGTRLNPEKAKGRALAIQWTFTDTNEKYLLTLSSSALNATKDGTVARPDASVALTKGTWDGMAMGKTTLDDALTLGLLKVTAGSADKLKELYGMLDEPELQFPIMTP